MFLYKGDWEDDDRCGWGELMYNSGDKYKGEWLDDKQRMFSCFIVFIVNMTCSW